MVYTCCDCNGAADSAGLEEIPDPPRCLECHLVAVIERAGARAWLRGERCIMHFLLTGANA
jgi:hypothetical protein